MGTEQLRLAFEMKKLIDAGQEHLLTEDMKSIVSSYKKNLKEEYLVAQEQDLLLTKFQEASAESARGAVEIKDSTSSTSPQVFGDQQKFHNSAPNSQAAVHSSFQDHPSSELQQ